MSFKLADELERRAAYPYVRGILLISTTADGIMIMIIDQEDVEPCVGRSFGQRHC